MWLWVLCVVLAGCGPVLLGEEERAPVAGSRAGEAGSGSSANGNDTRDAAVDPGATGAESSGAQPIVVVHVKPLDCGRCFALRAEGSGGTPPYAIEWGDGAQGAERMVCVAADGLALSVVVRDAASARSAAQSIQLEATDGGCPPPTVPAQPAPATGLCLKNPSLEGTPAPNLGQDQAFDAAPWSACINSASPPAMQPNTPDIGNESIAVTGAVPPPSDGNTYLALGEGEQVSQALCSELQAGTTVSLALDLQSFDISGGAVPSSEQVFLEIWGGLAADCSQHELLWTSPALAMGWKRYCMTLQPTAYTTQLTLRAGSDMSSFMPAYLFVDNLEPVASCP